MGTDIAGLWQPLAALTLASLAVMGTPGPSTISLTAVGASFGVRRSLAYAAGLIAGTTAVLLAVAAGVVALVTSVPHGALVLGVLSAAYILYLAFRIATAPPLDRRADAAAAPGFLGGFLLAIANPKAYVAIAAVFAGTTVFAGAPGLDAMVKTALLSVMIVLIHLCWLLAGASLSRLLRDPVSSRRINLALAAVLLAVTAATFIA
ncbi:LysE family transporter [Inquilinus limosus]|uniref:LysE family translocator n=1 Tax=Inquilinus limosus TaxID=171674 RepID=UPI003F192140